MTAENVRPPVPLGPSGPDPSRPHRATIKFTDGEIASLSHHDGDQHIMRVNCPTVAALAEPGSFVHLSCDRQLAMRRPMSIMRASPRDGWFDMLFKAHGLGTALLAGRTVGDTLSVLGPIGRPFRLRAYRRRPLLIGGGVGMPPMLFLAEHMRTGGETVEPMVVLGSEVPFPFRAQPSRIMVPGLPAATIAAMPLLDDWGIASRLASTNGYAGCFGGFVTELARRWLEHDSVDTGEVEIFACGPTPMLRAVQALARSYELLCELSLEEYMACAVGGCAGCTVRIDSDDGSAMKRVCVDGPVFDGASVVFQD